MKTVIFLEGICKEVPKDVKQVFMDMTDDINDEYLEKRAVKEMGVLGKYGDVVIKNPYNIVLGDTKSIRSLGRIRITQDRKKFIMEKCYRTISILNEQRVRIMESFIEEASNTNLGVIMSPMFNDRERLNIYNPDIVINFDKNIPIKVVDEIVALGMEYEILVEAGGNNKLIQIVNEDQKYTGWLACFNIRKGLISQNNNKYAIEYIGRAIELLKRRE